MQLVPQTTQRQIVDLYSERDATLRELDAVRRQLRRTTDQLAARERKITRLKRRIAQLEASVQAANKRGEAAYWVTCSGGCGRMGERLTQEIVDMALRNADRLRQYWNAYQARHGAAS